MALNAFLYGCKNSLPQFRKLKEKGQHFVYVFTGITCVGDYVGYWESRVQFFWWHVCFYIKVYSWIS